MAIREYFESGLLLQRVKATKSLARLISVVLEVANGLGLQALVFLTSILVAKQ